MNLVLQQFINNIQIKMINQKNYYISFQYDEKEGIKITLNNEKTLKKYQIIIKSIESSLGLTQWFDTLKDLNEHLQKQQNYRIDEAAKIFEIRGKHPTKPNLYLQIAKLKLNLLESRQQLKKNQIGQVISVCSSQQEITNSQIKKIFMILANGINNLIKQSNNQEKNQKDTFIKLYGQIISKKKEQLDQYFIKSRHQIQTFVQKCKQEPKRQLKKTQSELIYLKKQQDKQDYKSSIIMEIQKERKQKDEIFDAIINKMSNNFQSRDLRLDKIQDRIVEIQNSIYKIQDRLSQLEKVEAGEIFIDHECFSYKNILVEGRTIKKIKGEEADIFFKTKIKNKNTFTILINQLTGFMCVGVAGADLKTRQTFINQPNCVTLYNDGNFYNGASMRGKLCLGYAIGDIVQVNVSLDIGKIEWFVNNQLRLSYNYERLKNQIEWVPYVWISQNGTSFSIVE